MVAIAEKVRRYLAARPAVVECLRLGIINYSALAREISPSQPGDAVVQGVRRFKQRLKRERSTEGRLAKMLQNVEVVLRTGLILYPLPRLLSCSDRQQLMELGQLSFVKYFECETRAVAVCSADLEKRVPSALRGSGHGIRDIVQVSLRHSAEVVETPGVMARLFGTFAQGDVAVLESITCAGEQLLYVRARDLEKVVALLHSRYSSRGP